MDLRLATRRRGNLSPEALLDAATMGGATSLGWEDAGRIQVGALADLCVVGLDSARLAGLRREDLAAGMVFSAWAADVTHDHPHPTVVGKPDSGSAGSDSVGSDRQQVGAGLWDAWLVFGPGSDGRQQVLDVGTGTAPAADTRIQAEGQAVIPGFVDSHTHLIFAGDRSTEFTARMAGAPYEAGGIISTIDATREASDAELRDLLQARVTESRAAGITTREIKSGYAATTDGEARLLRLAGEVSDHTTLLGAHVTPPGMTTDDYVDLVIRQMTSACADLATSVDVFCEVGAFDVEQSRAVLQAGVAAGLSPKIHANQLGEGPGV